MPREAGRSQENQYCRILVPRVARVAQLTDRKEEGGHQGLGEGDGQSGLKGQSCCVGRGRSSGDGRLHHNVHVFNASELYTLKWSILGHLAGSVGGAFDSKWP